MSDTFPDETLYPVLTSLADEDRIFASNSAVSHESSQIKGSTIKGLINALKGTPPETLDTLAKLAAAINNDPAFHTTLATALGLKQNASNAVTTDTPQIVSGQKHWDTSGTGNEGFIFDRYSIRTVRSNISIRPNAVGIYELYFGNQTYPYANLWFTYVGSVRLPSVNTTANDDRAASTAFVQAQKANTALTGTPTAPTAAVGTNSTQIATTAFCAAGFLPQFSAVVECTTNITAEPNKLYVNVKDDSAENTLMLTLPSPTGNAGKVIGLTSRYRRSSFTNEEANWRLTGHIDGIASNTYWQGYWELGSALLWCDGTTWHMLTDWRAEQEW